MITMKHKFAYIELKFCVTELKLMTRSHFIEILMILTKSVFDISDRVFHNCGVRNSEVLLYQGGTWEKCILLG